MCLVAYKSSTEALKKKLKSKRVYFYKVYELLDGSLYPPIYGYVRVGVRERANAIGFEVKSDFVKYDGDYSYDNFYKGVVRDINQGIHVYKTLKDAMSYRNNRKNRVVYRVTGKNEDLLGSDRDRAVFRKIKIEKEMKT